MGYEHSHHPRSQSGKLRYSFGSFPNRLSPDVPSRQVATTIKIIPINGTKLKSTHQPLISLSWNRRTRTLSWGIREIKQNNPDSRPMFSSPSQVPIVLSKRANTIVTQKINKLKVQNSVLVALPENWAYFLYGSKNIIYSPILVCCYERSSVFFAEKILRLFLSQCKKTTKLARQYSNLSTGCGNTLRSTPTNLLKPQIVASGWLDGADEWDWTTDLLITNQLLYHWATSALQMKYETTGRTVGQKQWLSYFLHYPLSTWFA